MDSDFIPCTLRTLPAHLTLEAAATAKWQNPANAPLMSFPGILGAVAAAAGVRFEDERAQEPGPTPAQIAMITSRWWSNGGVALTVSFMEQQPADLRRRILEHMNSWQQSANVKFSETAQGGQVRISLGGGGYWSYLGTDILHIPASEQTMNLEGFTMNSSESEFRRVIRHETGHTLGSPHEHMRKQLVSRLDRNKTINYFRQMAGWSQQTTIQQVLTPLDDSLLTETPLADQDSIMCYQLPAQITIDGQPIRGGTDINALDFEFMGKLYPRPVQPPPPPPPTGGTVTLPGAGTYKIVTGGDGKAVLTFN